MEEVYSRKNPLVVHLKKLGADGEYRRQRGEFLCEGSKLLEDALAAGVSVGSVLFCGEARPAFPGAIRADNRVMAHISTLKSPPDVLFSCPMLAWGPCPAAGVMILDGLQDPGNVGTIIRTASAMGIPGVVLTGDCADLYNPKTVRATMGAVFRQPVYKMDGEGVRALVSGGALYGAALAPDSREIQEMDLQGACVAIGSEGSGLSPEILALCTETMMIPMRPGTESLNAAMAAGIIMWEMAGRNDRRTGER